MLVAHQGVTQSYQTVGCWWITCCFSKWASPNFSVVPFPQADRHWQKEHPAGKACVADISRSNVTEKEAANDQCQASSPNRYSEYNLLRTHMPSASNAFQAKAFGELTRGIWRANLDEGVRYCSMSQFAYICKAEKFSNKQAPSPSSLGLHRFSDTFGNDFTDSPIPGIGSGNNPVYRACTVAAELFESASLSSDEEN